MSTEQALAVVEGTSVWTPEVERFLAEQADFTALPFSLKLLSEARGALFFLDGQAVYAEYDGGRINSKFVDTEGVRSAFFYEATDSGWMPPQVKRHGQTPKGHWAVQYFPPQRYVLELAHPPDSKESEATKLTVTLPALIFFGYKTDYHVWAAEGSEFNPHAQIFHVPVPNIYGNGRVCFGSNRPPEVTGPNLDAGWDLFLRSPYNCAHAVRRSRQFPDHICDAIYHHVARAGEDEPYPLSDLFPYYMTVDDAIGKIIHGLGMPSQAREMGGGMIMHGFNEPEDGDPFVGRGGGGEAPAYFRDELEEEERDEDEYREDGEPAGDEEDEEEEDDDVDEEDDEAPEDRAALEHLAGGDNVQVIHTEQ